MRVLERFLSLVLALAVVAASLLLALEVGWAVAGRKPLVVPWHHAYTAGAADAWSSTSARVLAVVLLVVGLLLLLAELKPRRVPRLRMTTVDPAVDAALTRRSLRQAVVSAAKQVDGISTAKATVGRRRVTVRAVSRLGTADTASDLNGQLEAAVRDRLTGLQLATPPRLRVTVTPRRETRSA